MIEPELPSEAATYAQVTAIARAAAPSALASLLEIALTGTDPVARREAASSPHLWRFVQDAIRAWRGRTLH